MCKICYNKLRVGEILKKKLITLLFSLLIISGCTINNVLDSDISTVISKILYTEKTIKNLFMEGYELYLPQGVQVVDKSDYNLKIKDKKSIYYLYIDTIAYYYKTPNSFEKKTGHYYSERISNNGKSGYIDIVENGDYYFVVLMYNYAKIESYVLKENFNASFINMCDILSTVKYNDKVIGEYVGQKGMTYQEEKFNIFDSDAEIDNFLKYEEEYGTYKDKIDINKDNDIISIEDIVE